MIDGTDAKILNIVQDDARVSNAEIARQVGLAPSATLERLRKLQESGVIAGYTGRVDPKSVGLGLLAFVFVRADDMKDPRAIAKRLAAIPEVLEVHNVAGEDCYVVKLRAADTSDLGRLLNDRVRKVAGVRSTRTTIVLETFKETTTLPLGRTGAGGEEAR
jgi:Lrp/AsnC family leucine-responsive transcriptional regulator